MSGLSKSDVVLLRKYLSNIEAHGDNMKYRRIRLENARFAPTWANAFARDLLNAAGWRTDKEDGYIVLPNEVQPDVMRLLLSEYPEYTSEPNPNTEVHKVADDQQTEKQALIAEQRQQYLDQKRRDLERKRRLKAEIEADRAQVATVQSRPSVQNRPTFGSNIARYSDIGVDLNRSSG
eukprot:m.83520 g.83520  ORF g.83520 m.83520 type:complete len:178 (-) comp16349_c0_seq1:572-1105(-)